MLQNALLLNILACFRGQGGLGELRLWQWGAEPRVSTRISACGEDEQVGGCSRGCNLNLRRNPISIAAGHSEMNQATTAACLNEGQKRAGGSKGGGKEEVGQAGIRFTQTVKHRLSVCLSPSLPFHFGEAAAADKVLKQHKLEESAFFSIFPPKKTKKRRNIFTVCLVMWEGGQHNGWKYSMYAMHTLENICGGLGWGCNHLQSGCYWFGAWFLPPPSAVLPSAPGSCRSGAAGLRSCTSLRLHAQWGISVCLFRGATWRWDGAGLPKVIRYTKSNTVLLYKPAVTCIHHRQAGGKVLSS